MPSTLRTFAGQSGSLFWCLKQFVCSYFSQSRWFCVSLTSISSWILALMTVVSLRALITCSCQTYRKSRCKQALSASHTSVLTQHWLPLQYTVMKWPLSGGDQAKPNQINQPTNQTDKNDLFLAEKIGAKKFIRPYLSVLVAGDIEKFCGKRCLGHRKSSSFRSRAPLPAHSLTS